jgi:hypothetical protein
MRDSNIPRLPLFRRRNPAAATRRVLMLQHISALGRHGNQSLVSKTNPSLSNGLSIRSSAYRARKWFNNSFQRRGGIVENRRPVRVRTIRFRVRTLLAASSSRHNNHHRARASAQVCFFANRGTNLFTAKLIHAARDVSSISANSWWQRAPIRGAVTQSIVDRGELADISLQHAAIPCSARIITRPDISGFKPTFSRHIR